MTAENPFQEAVLDYTLAVGRDATLTLATDSLILLDESLAHRRISSCCGFSLPQKSIPTRSIPYYNILWAELTPELNILISHASPVPAISPLSTFLSSKDQVRVARIEYPVDKSQHSIAKTFVARLIDLAYGASLRRKRIKVLINPHGGTGNASKMYTRDIAPILEAAHCELDVVTTRHRGHAEEIARAIDTEHLDVIACCSGDGTPHEVFNGLGARKDAIRALQKIAVAQLPCGSGNAMCHNLFGTETTSLAALALVKGLRMPFDLCSVTQGSKRYLSFLSQAVGIVAECDLASEHLRWMGDLRFTYGLASRILGKTIYPCEVAVKCCDDSKSSIRARYVQEVANACTPPQSSNLTGNDLYSDDVSTSTDAVSKSDASVIKGDYPSYVVSTKQEDGALPMLRHGTVQDALPSNWEYPLRPYLNMGNFYSGNMSWMAADTQIFRAAMPSDGCLDLITIDGDCSRSAAVKVLLDVGGGKAFENDIINYRKVEAYRIIPHPREGKEGYISIDGERVPFEPFQVEVHRGLGMVLSKTGKGYEGPLLEP